VNVQNDASLKLPAPQPPENAAHDSLADALLHLAAFHGRAISREALIAGLPLQDGRLSAVLFDRAAKRAGLEAEAIRRDIADIPPLVLPAVLVMRDNSTRIVVAKDDRKQTATVINPSSGSAEATVALGSLILDYSGYAFLVKPSSTADPRTAAAGDLPRDHWFWSVAKRYWPNYTHVAVASLLVNILALASPLFIMSVYDRVVPNGAIPSLVALSIGMVIAIVFDFVMRTVRSRIIDLTGKKLDVVLAAHIYEHVISLKLTKRPPSVGILANQIRDFDSVRDFFTSGSVVSAIDLIFAMIFIAVLFVIAGPLAWIPLIMFPVMIAIGLLIQWPLSRAMKRLQAESAARHGILVESLSGIESIRASGAEARMQTGWERSVAATARTGEDVHFWSSLALTSANTAQQITTLLMVIVGVFLIVDGKLTVGALVAATMLAGRVLAPIAGIASVITRATQMITAMRAIDRIMSLDRERTPERSYVTRRIDEGRIAFENVSFKYPDAPEQALKGVSFTIAPGERVGIIGRIGSGKTTIGRLLAGFYEPDEGRILVDGVDARQYDPADLRTGIGFVLQDNELFFGKLRENIALGKPQASDEEILQAARLAGVESFVATHPLGYDMAISEGGRSLSGGQRQAICLARILIRQPRILFLDEPTAHFDVRSEAEFLERLRDIAEKNLTVIVSTHRPSLLSLVSRILVFDRGLLVADGPRDEILERLRTTATQGRPAPSVKPAFPEKKTAS
jgi:ATP-binding cassette subfamily C protein LapB